MEIERLIENMTMIAPSSGEVVRTDSDVVELTTVSDGLGTKITEYKSGNYPLANAPLTHTVTDDYQKLILSFTNDLMTEYECKTPTEKALAEMAAISFAKALDYGEELRNCRAIEFHSGAKNGYFSMISKEVDRANRQFMTALMALRQTKAPKVEINVTATNAFMAKEQQFNMDRPVRTQYENVEPK